MSAMCVFGLKTRRARIHVETSRARPVKSGIKIDAENRRFRENLACILHGIL